MTACRVSCFSVGFQRISGRVEGTHVGLPGVELLAEREEARVVLLLRPLGVAVQRLV